MRSHTLQDPTPKDLHVLQVLLASPQPITVNAIAQQTHLTPTQVIDGLSQLEQWGAHLHRDPHLGVQLIETGIALWQPMLAYALGLSESHIRIYQATSSTQDRARELVQPIEMIRKNQRLLQAITVSDVQSAGRGRMGRQWVAPAGSSLLMSLVFANQADHLDMARTIAASAVAVLDAIEQTTQQQLDLKWPNDVVTAQGDKLAGILVESTGSHLVIGLGINVNEPSPPPPLGAWLSTLTGRRICRLALLISVIQSLEKHLSNLSAQAVQTRWRERCRMIDEPVQLLSQGKELAGHVLDIDLDAGLIVRTHTGQVVHLSSQTTSILHWGSE